LESKKDQPDYGRVLGQILIRPCTGKRRSKQWFHRKDSIEYTTLLADDEYIECEPELDSEDDPLPQKSKHREKRQTSPRAPVIRPGWGQIFTPQSNLILLAYSMLAMHSMAFDALIPVFLHHEKLPLYDNPNVKFPFKFSGGFGIGTVTCELLTPLTL
jgi:hypothetical protein